MSAAHAPVTFVASHAELGGQERYLRTILRALDRDAVRGVVALADGPALPGLAALGHPTWLVRTGARAGLLVGAARLRRVLLAGRAELVHADGIKAALCSVLATAGTGIPVVWMKHDRSLDGPVGRWVAARCTAVAGVSRAVTAPLDRVAGADVHVVPNGIPAYAVDRGAAREELRRLAGARSDAEVVVQVGRIVGNKGQLETVAAVARVRRTRADVRLVLVGDVDRTARGYLDAVRARAGALGIAHALTLTGYREDAVRLIAGADVLVAPSLPQPGFYGWREGFGLVAAEAMAVGTPVVASDDPALAETLAGCGVLVPAGDTDALAAALEGVLADPVRRERMVAAGRARARELRLDRALERLEDVYRAASRSRAGSAVR